MLVLYASQNHCGDLFGGHYTATVLDEESGKWYDFDDSSVTEVGVAPLFASICQCCWEASMYL